MGPVLTRRALVFFLFLALAGCAGRAPKPPLPSYATGQACFAQLVDRQVLYVPAASPGRGGCGVADPIQVSEAGTIVWATPALVSCPLAAALAAFSREAVQPLAVRELGQVVVALHHLGAWDCRRRTGGSGKMSEHARGRAFDLAAFELADGSRVSVKQDFYERSPRGRFLQAISREACRYFSVVLTPDSDRWHHDHFHLDVGPHRACG
jgi:hypothetical protein